jgi:PAS domain S-box-containing protein
VRLVQGRDVTRRLQVEEALKENLKLFLAFVESSTEPSLMTDEKGMILAVSKPGVELLCSSRASVVGQNVLRYIPSEQLPILEKSFDTLLREPLRPRIAVVRLRLLDGSNIWVEAVCSMLRVDDRIGGYIVSLKRLEIAALNNS